MVVWNDELYGVIYNEWFVNQKSTLDAFVDDSFTVRFVWFNEYVISPMCFAITIRHKWIETLYSVNNWTAHSVWCCFGSIAFTTSNIVYKMNQTMRIDASMKTFYCKSKQLFIMRCTTGICVPLWVRLILTNNMIKGYIFSIFVKNMSFIKWSILFFFTRLG